VFESVLVANRGEIAARVIRTLQRLGVRAVLAASIPDRHSLAASLADHVVLLEGYSATETYLDGDAIVAAARESGCEAVHPGYGFLSERADFAERCAAAGLVFVGPPPAVLRLLGDKSRAREAAASAGVPIVPGYDGPDDTPTLVREAERIGYPVMIKARGGGGGRGMREVRDPAAFPEEVEAARREAASAFGDPGLLLEQKILEAHHVEVQVLADAHGNAVHLGERDCSVQRRRQKLVEESPSPVVDAALRAGLTDAALRIARDAGYVNVGTVEFLVGPAAPDGRRPFYFLEVNPRLQVEHPVTEMRTGLDLVELQLRIAAGEPLPFDQAGISFEGHAVEFRINAEDPAEGFRPSSGRLGMLAINADRLDAGYRPGDRVPPQYDSLVAKAVFFGQGRGEVLHRAAAALRADSEGSAVTNTRFLQAIARAPAFQAGMATVDWLEREAGALVPDARTPGPWWAAAARWLQAQGVAAWLGPGRRQAWLSDGYETRALDLDATGEPGAARQDIRVQRCPEDPAQPLEALVVTDDKEPLRPAVRFRPAPPPALPRRVHAATEGSTAVTAPLAGTVVDIRVQEGDTVAAGDLLALLEAMKMEHRIVASAAGVVKRVAVRARDVVREGDLIVELE
jgi:acetyl/propionyl-CoA carboxylase alpha subunit